MLMPLRKMMSAWDYTDAESFLFEAGDWCFSEATVKMSSLSFLLTLLFSGTSNPHLLELICEGEQSGLYEYKIFGGLADIPPKLCADVYMDLDFRKEWDQYVKGASSAAPAGEEEKLFLWVTADLQGIPTESWFGIYYAGKESPIWGTVLALSVRLLVYSGLTFKNRGLEDIEHLRHKSAVKEEEPTVTVKVNHLSGSHSSLLQTLSQQEFTLAQPQGSSGPLPSVAVAASGKEPVL